MYLADCDLGRHSMPLIPRYLEGLLRAPGPHISKQVKNGARAPLWSCLSRDGETTVASTSLLLAPPAHFIYTRSAP